MEATSELKVGVSQATGICQLCYEYIAACYPSMLNDRGEAAGHIKCWERRPDNWPASIETFGPLKPRIIRKDTLFLMTSGDYSSYSIHGLCRAMQDIDLAVLEQEYLECHPELNRPFLADEYRFMKWVIVDKQLAEELEYQELALDRYDSLHSTLHDGGHL